MAPILKDMKTILMFIFTVFVAIALGEDSSQRAFPGGGKMRESKSTKAYKKAKEACLKGDAELKGKKLTECIVNYQKEAK